MTKEEARKYSIRTILRESLHTYRIFFGYAPVLSAVFILVFVLSSLTTPLSIVWTRNLVDSIGPYIAGKLPLSELVRWGVLTLLSLVFLSTGNMLTIAMEAPLNRAMTEHLLPAIAEKFRKLQYPAFEDPEVHNIIQRMSQDPCDRFVRIFIYFTRMLTLTISFGGVVLVFWNFSHALGVLFALFLVPTLIFSLKRQIVLKRVHFQQSESERRLNYLSKLTSEKASVAELKVFGAEGFILDKWKTISGKMLSERLAAGLRTQRLGLAQGLMNAGAAGILIGYLLFSMREGRGTIGEFIALIGSLGTLESVIFWYGHSASNLVVRTFEISWFSRLMAMPERPEPTDVPDLSHPVIRFEDVSFTYPGAGRKVLDHCSFTLDPDGSTALVGPNGAGKSTIIKLLCGLYQPDEGRITINGADIRELGQTHLYNNISVVFQDYFNYSLTLREAVALSSLDRLHDDAALTAALEAVGFGEKLRELPEGLDTKLGKLEQHGVDLSGGQWQRIAIARAVLAQGAFAVLDEPTAALDPMTECAMYENFSRIMRGRGSLVISHRLASARIAQRILVLGCGRIIEDGDHDTLMAKNGTYAGMYRAQAHWYETDTAPAGEPVPMEGE